MKNSIKICFVLLMAAFVSIPVMAQSNIADRMFRDFNSKDEVTYLSFSKSLLSMMDFDDSINSDDHEISGDLDEVKVAIYKPNATPDVSFRDQVLKYLKKGSYKLVEDDDTNQDDDAEVWVLRKGRKVSECHIIFQGEENGVLLSFFGDFKVEDLDNMRNKMDDYK